MMLVDEIQEDKSIYYVVFQSKSGCEAAEVKVSLKKRFDHASFLARQRAPTKEISISTN